MMPEQMTSQLKFKIKMYTAPENMPLQERRHSAHDG